MASRKSENSKYQSLYGGGFVTSAQILSEIMCARMAKSNRSFLPFNFWNIPEWSTTFLWQLRLANKILKEFHESVVSRVLRSKQGIHFLSLTNKQMLPMLKIEQKKYDAEIKRLEELQPTEVQTSLVIRPTFVVKKSVLDILRELENE